MRILGAIIAGGKARRFGSDKALALLGGRPLIGIIANGLQGQVAETVVCGREMTGMATLVDRPAADLGPLGGLCAALHHAQLHGYESVLSVAADVVPVPPGLADLLAAASRHNARATVVAGQHLLGLWPTILSAQLDDHLAGANDRSMFGWIDACGAVSVSIPVNFTNINTVEDLAGLNPPLAS